MGNVLQCFQTCVYCQQVRNLYQQAKHDIYYMLHPFTHQLESYIQDQKWDLIDIFIFYSVILFIIIQFIKYLYSDSVYPDYYNQLSLKSRLIKWLIKNIPMLKKKVQLKLQALEKDFEKEQVSIEKHRTTKLLEQPMKLEKIEEKLQKWYERDEKLSHTGRNSGARYSWDKNFEDSMKEFTKNFIFHNPLHIDIFPASRTMEAEVNYMTCNMFNQKTPCGILTTGGTESILLAMLAHRNYYKEEKGITKPNIVIPNTAHAAFIKACLYFNIEIRRVPINENTYQVDLKKMASLIDKNTICIVGSFPNYPNGAEEQIPELAKLALKKKIGFHVDCCLGSFIVPFAKRAIEELKLKIQLPVCDFTVDGISSISCDHHKYGMAPKGVSIVMFCNNELRQSCYTAIHDWPGGYYATAQTTGSRSGTPIAGAWFTMMYHGVPKYLENAKKIISAVYTLSQAIKKISELELMGEPKICVVSFKFKKSTNLDIYGLHKILQEKNWLLSGCQNPPSVHVSITLGIAYQIQDLIKDLQLGVEELKANPNKYKHGKCAQLYASKATLPDNFLLEFGIKKIVDCMMKP